MKETNVSASEFFLVGVLLIDCCISRGLFLTGSGYSFLVNEQCFSECQT